MTEPTAPHKKPFLYVVVCASGVAPGVGTLITAAQQANWDVGVVATPQGLGFIDATAVEAQTGHPIRSAWRSPGDPRPLPPPDAIAVAPATFNTINKWAAGISDGPCRQHGAVTPASVSAARRDEPPGLACAARCRHRPLDVWSVYECRLVRPVR